MRFLFLTLPFVLGCQTTCPCPAVPRAWGAVSAPTPTELQQLTEAVEAARAELAKVPGFIDRPLRVCFVDEIREADGLQGAIDEAADEVFIIRGAQGDGLRQTVAHELAHAYLGEESYRELPQAVEEGLCNLVAAPFDEEEEALHLFVSAIYVPLMVSGRGPNFSSLLAPAHRRELPTVEDVLTVSNRSYLAGSAAKRNAVLAVGGAVARAIGPAGLLELCERARAEGLKEVPADWFLAAAGLEDADDWLRLVGEMTARLEVEDGGEKKSLTLYRKDEE